MISAQGYINQKYPTKEERENIEKLNINEKKLEGHLDLREFINLKSLVLYFNEITSLDVSKCSQLTFLDCGDNLLTNLDLTKNLKLNRLYIWNNNFTERDLTFISHLVNLEELCLGNRLEERINRQIYNRFSGSLKPLENLNKLWKLNISNTNIDSGLEYLPECVSVFEYGDECGGDSSSNTWGSIKFRYKSIKGYGLCQECNQPNTGKSWCRDCIQRRFKEWTSGNQEIDEFIQKRQLKGMKIEWIPYEQFIEIEKIAEGGFSKVYKAKRDNNEFALKSLNNSQGMTVDLLREVFNHESVGSDFNMGGVVLCHGISQDPTTKDYIMVMQYIPDGNLRNYQNNKSNRDDLHFKILQMHYIWNSLRSIHYHGFIHSDFHPGNILNRNDSNNIINCFITDLGLCKPVNCQKEEGIIFGVIPYVAPEVLLGQPYTQESDIYSFGIVVYEMITGLPPYYDLIHDEFLALRICGGLRPKFTNVKIPRLLENFIKRCWDADPAKRPVTADFGEWWWEVELDNVNSEFTRQYREVEKFNKTLSDEIKHPKYKLNSGLSSLTSKMINTKENQWKTSQIFSVDRI